MLCQIGNREQSVLGTTLTLPQKADCPITQINKDKKHTHICIVLQEKQINRTDKPYPGNHQSCYENL